EEAKAKTIVAKAGEDVSIKNLEVSSSSSEFTTKVESQPSGKEFRINVKPRQTTNAASATLTIKPNLPNGKSNVLSARVSFTPPPSKRPHPVAATPLRPGNQASPAATA